MQNILWLAFSVIGLAACSYLPEQEIHTSEKYSIEETEDYIRMRPVDRAVTSSIMFIPGGLVDPHAYISTFHPLVETQQREVFILKVRGNLAILNPKSVERVRAVSDEHSWVIGGHSLGGVLACQSLKKRNENWAALFLLGSYSTIDLSEISQPVLTLRGSHDGLTTQGDWDKYESNLPEKYDLDTRSWPVSSTHNMTLYQTIEGGNHAQWGNYGAQINDGAASISRIDQQLEFNSTFITFLQLNAL